MRTRQRRGRAAPCGASGSYLALLGTPEQSFGPEQDDQQEHDERDALLVGGRHVETDEVLEDADQHAAEQRATGLVEAADDRGEERLLPDRVAHVELRQV